MPVSKFNSAIAAKQQVGLGVGALRNALAGAGDIAYVWNLHDDTIDWDGSSPDFARLGGADRLTHGHMVTARLYTDDRRRRANRLQAHLTANRPYDCEYRLVLDDGNVVWVHDRGAVLPGEAMHGVWRFIAPDRAREGTAGEDELTGLYNRPRLREALDFVLTAALRTARPGGYLVVGVDKLGNVNDSFGEDVGDTVLVEVGRRLEATLRASDVLGRVGADRFGIVFAECPEDHVAAACERILIAVNHEPVRTSAGPVYATVSVGAATFPEQGKVAQEIMNRAEHALTEAKSQGRDCYSTYALSEDQRVKHRIDMAMGERVQRALREDRLVFAYQPVVASGAHGDAGRVDYYECLLRMIDEDGKPVAAAHFIPVIERLGFVRIIDRYVLERAVQEAAAHPGVCLGLNISGMTATDRSWLRAATRLLRDRPEVARRLVVEITETAAMGDIEECARFVEALRGLGCRVAIDDFGVGFTSLRHLQLLAVDTVKIDGSFVRDLADKIENQVFLRHLVGLAHGLGFTTVAEGVESEREAAILRREGVGLLQGYYFARPSIDAPWKK